MLKYMLDTNMVIYTMKNRPEHVKIRFNQKRVFEGIPDEGRFTGPPGAEQKNDFLSSKAGRSKIRLIMSNLIFNAYCHYIPQQRLVN
jgi:hypothetical protein